jgi:hypothetical protein
MLAQPGIFGHFKTFVNFGLPASAKTTSMSQNRIFNAQLGSSGGAMVCGEHGIGGHGEYFGGNGA